MKSTTKFAATLILSFTALAGMATVEANTDVANAAQDFMYNSQMNTSAQFLGCRPEPSLGHGMWTCQFKNYLGYDENDANSSWWHIHTITVHQDTLQPAPFGSEEVLSPNN